MIFNIIRRLSNFLGWNCWCGGKTGHWRRAGGAGRRLEDRLLRKFREKVAALLNVTQCNTRFDDPSGRCSRRNNAAVKP